MKLLKAVASAGAEGTGKLSAVLIISFFLLAAISFVLYRTKRQSLKSAAEQDFFPTPARGLFEDDSRGAAGGDGGGAGLASIPYTHAGDAARLRERASRGELAALGEARLTGDKKLYDEVLGALLKRDPSAENVRAVAAHVIAGRDLRASRMLAGALLTLWRLSPDNVPVTDFLRVAALSDDAGVYRAAVEEVAEAWEQGRFPGRSAEDLCRLFESEYWVLAPEAIRTGAGFRLKQQLAEVRRRLSAAPPPRERLSTQPDEVEAGDTLR
ncbi:MAG TPA: hypothetical protein VF240_11620 [Pyrinomonadaceae bacterium]